ncbi:MAG: hypothetical protein BroJett040_04650 [Oligoflexia bacterium]|nr:MAG: hypothetical protein BroJett040_04650 [Oligoflexia bacterium]
MKTLFLTLLLPIFSYGQTDFLVKAAEKKAIQNLKGCTSQVINPHLGGDILKVRCENTYSLMGLSPLENLQFEEETVWRTFQFETFRLSELNDPMANDQWALDTLRINEFWNKQSRGSDQVKVAVIDTGIDYEHEDLAANIGINTKEIPNNKIDDDKNGYVDDVYGWNSYDNNNFAMDTYRHGTHVSGIIGAKPGNGIGVAGLNWNVALIPIRFIGANGGGSTESAIRAFDYAVARGAKIVNASWGGAKDSPLLKETIARCRDKGVLVIAAAGNDTADNDKVPTYPASFDLDNIISVAATDLHEDLAYFTNWGKKTVHVAAPGASILSTINEKKYGYLDGTSMAAPHITGVVALLWAKNPQWSYQQIRSYILKNCVQVPAWKDQIGCGGYFRF